MSGGIQLMHVLSVDLCNLPPLNDLCLWTLHLLPVDGNHGDACGIAVAIKCISMTAASGLAVSLLVSANMCWDEAMQSLCMQYRASDTVVGTHSAWCGLLTPYS